MTIVYYILGIIIAFIILHFLVSYFSAVQMRTWIHVIEKIMDEKVNDYKQKLNDYGKTKKN